MARREGVWKDKELNPRLKYTEQFKFFCLLNIITVLQKRTGGGSLVFHVGQHGTSKLLFKMAHLK